MQNQKRKRNHYVPQSYLRSFAADSVRKKIWSFPTHDGAPRLKSIEKVAVKFYLYAPAGPKGRDYSFENKLSDLEQFFGSPHWHNVSTSYVDLGDETLRKMISLLAAVMYLRNPAQLDFMSRFHSQFVGLLSQPPGLPDEIEIAGKVLPFDKEGWPAYRDANDEEIKRMWLQQVGSAVFLAKLFLDMRWSVVCSDEPVFITSDNPVTPVHDDLPFRGFRNPGTAVMFPLSPTRLLWLDHKHDEPKGQYYPVKDTAPTSNYLLWRNALSNWFSHRDPHHICAEIVECAENMGYA